MKRNRQAGQALVLASFGLTVFMLAAGLAIDMGYLRYQKRRMQSAADSAAIAGASELVGGNASVNAGALADASANGFVDASLGGTATVTPTIITCPNSTPNNCVQVVISQQQPLFFMRIVPNISRPTVSAQAIAELGNGRGCIYALGNGGIVAGGLTAGAMDLEANYCTVLSDGPLTLANGIVKRVNAEGVGYAQTYDGGTSFVSPAPKQIVPSADPLAYLQSQMAPSSNMGTCSPSGNGIACQPGDYPSGITITAVSPTQLSVQFSSNPVSGTVTSSAPNLNVSFSPGFYSLGGNLTVAGNFSNPTAQSAVINGMISGYGVTFYAYGSASLAINAGVNAQGPYTADYPLSCGGSAMYGNNTVAASGFYVGEQVQFSAPADSSNGGVPGVLFMQNAGDANSAWITLANGDGMDSPGVWDTNGCNGPPGSPSTASYMWGTIYAPGATVNLDGIGIESVTPTNMCSTLPRFTEVVASALNPTNNINIGVNDCAIPPTQYQATVNSQAVPNAIKDATLVE
jgi:Putative Flp pilus-assembly TadE/G-like